MIDFLSALHYLEWLCPVPAYSSPFEIKVSAFSISVHTDVSPSAGSFLLPISEHLLFLRVFIKDGMTRTDGGIPSSRHAIDL